MSTILPSRMVSTWYRSWRLPFSPIQANEPMNLSPLTTEYADLTKGGVPPYVASSRFKASRTSSGPRQEGVDFHQR